MSSIVTLTETSSVTAPQSNAPTTQIGTTAQAAAAAQEATKNDSSSVASSILHASLLNTPRKITSANGNWLYTSDPQHKILDATGGAAVACLGHNHPRIKAAITEQLSTGLAYAYSPFFSTQPAEDLAKHLVATTNGHMSRVFVVSSGTEAIEAGLKLARQYFIEKEGKDTKRVRFISRKQSYHGNTLGALAVGGHVARKKIYAGIYMAENVGHVSPCYAYRGMRDGMTEGEYVDSLVQEFEDELMRVGPETVCAFVAETMSGLTLGAVPPVKGYLKRMKAMCDKFGILMLLDEVMCGMGRTGTLHAWEQEDVIPDLQTVAKGLGAGYEPIGALLVHRDVVKVLEQGTGGFVHSQTYQGHSVACAAALEVQNVVKEEQLLENVRSLAPFLEALLREKLGTHPNVGDIRGRGFMWAVEFVKNKDTREPFAVQDKVAARMHAAGLGPDFGISVLPGGGVADGTNGDVIMLAPAYNCTKEDIASIVEKTMSMVEHILGK